MTPEQWLEREFFPVVESLAGASVTDQADPRSTLKAVLSLRLLGAVDALRAVGFLDDDQDARCRAALDVQGIKEERKTVSIYGTAVVAGAVASSRLVAPEGTALPGKDRLRQVVAVNEPMGQIDGQSWTVTAAEIWQQQVRASFLIEISEQAALGFPGADVAWTLEAAGVLCAGRLASGHGGEDWHRLDVAWDVVLPERCQNLVITAVGADQGTGRVSVNLPPARLG